MTRKELLTIAQLRAKRLNRYKQIAASRGITLSSSGGFKVTSSKITNKKTVFEKDEYGFDIIKNNMNFKKAGSDKEMSFIERMAALENSIKESAKILKLKM